MIERHMEKPLEEMDGITASRHQNITAQNSITAI
jgi:hypothetical protein